MYQPPLTNWPHMWLSYHWFSMISCIIIESQWLLSRTNHLFISCSSIISVYESVERLLGCLSIGSSVCLSRRLSRKFLQRTFVFARVDYSTFILSSDCLLVYLEAVSSVQTCIDQCLLLLALYELNLVYFLHMYVYRNYTTRIN